MVLVSVALLAGLAGCGDGGDELPPVASPENSKTVKWAVDVCDGLTGWLRDLQDRAAPLTGQMDEAANLGEVRTVLVGFFEETVRETDEMVEGIEQLGDPPIDGGEQAAARFRQNLAPVQAHFVEARDEAARLPVDDVAAFAAARDPLLASIHGGAQLVRVAYADLEKGEPRRLGKLAAQELECDFVYDDGPDGPAPPPGFSIRLNL